MDNIVASVRIVVVTMLICVLGYASAIRGVAVAVPDQARGSLLTTPDGEVIGSRLVAQEFTMPRYFWARPSAVDYNAAGAGGSNKSPTSADLTERARGLIDRYGATEENPLPAELATASGSGLDPHITLRAALYQVPRVASARGQPQAEVEALATEMAFASGGILAPDLLVNVLELNLAMDARYD